MSARSTPSRHQTRFCATSDGVNIAYAVAGSGMPIVKTPHWHNHVELDAKGPAWGAFIQRISQSHRFVRYDPRGSGLSDREVPDVSLATHQLDLEAVVAAGGLDRFALFGCSQGAAIAVEYAARHPERVSHLILYGGYLQGMRRREPLAESAQEADAMIKLVELSWGREDSAFRKLFATQFIPDGTPGQLKAFDEVQREAVAPAMAARMLSVIFDADVSESATRVRCPTLVIHSRGDARVPFEQGRRLACAIPGAQFITLDSRNHVLLDHEPAYEQFFREVRDFLSRHGVPAAAPAVAPELAALTPAETRVLDLLAAGLSNDHIAQRLAITPKTVRNHVTHIFHKLGVESRARAIVLARDQGLGAQG